MRFLPKLIQLVCATAIIASAALQSANADGTRLDDPPPELTELELRQITALLTAPGASPGIAFGSPVAFGANWGDVFASVGGSEVAPGSPNDYDGGMAIGAGIGNANARAGLQLTANIISLEDDFAEDGNIGAKFHTVLGPGTAIAIGAENLMPWGDAKRRDESYYAVVTKIILLNPANPINALPLSISVGAGTERFVDKAMPKSSDVEAFGAIALSPHRRFSVIADWTGRALNAGVSLVPLGRLPITVTLGVTDVTEEAPSGARFSAGAGVSWHFGD